MKKTTRTWLTKKPTKTQPYGDSKKNTLVLRTVCVGVCVGLPDSGKLLGGAEVPEEVSDSATQRWKDGGGDRCGWVTVQC